MIGASRITYAMASYRQLPEAFRRLHPRFKTPWLSLVVFAGVVSILAILPGQTDFLGTMYSFGAMLSFTVAHASIVALRAARRRTTSCSSARARTSAFGGVDWPLFAILGGLATGSPGSSSSSRSRPRAGRASAGSCSASPIYVVYRRRVVHEPSAATVRAPAAYGPALALEYRRLLVPVAPGQASDDALDVAASLAAERGAQIVAVNVIEIPLDRPLATETAELEELAHRELDEARRIGDSYGVDV